MNQWKSAHAAKTKTRTLEEAMKGADAFFGLSVAGAVTKDMVKDMAKSPIIFAMANPDPEITPEEAREVRKDVIFATGVFIALARMVNACMSLVEACGGARAKCYVRLLSSRRRERTERRTRGVL